MSAGASTVAKGSCATGCLEVLAWHLGVSSTAKAFKCQCCNCLCTQIVWKTSFIVLVLFKNVHNSDVIYKTGCLQNLFCILRCVYCQKKGKDEKWCFSTTVSSDCVSVSLPTDRCSSGVSPPFLWSYQKRREASESLYSLGKKVLCLKNGTCFLPIYFVNLYSDYHENVSCIFFFLYIVYLL